VLCSGFVITPRHLFQLVRHVFRSHESQNVNLC
jgi:hypothetical protein